MSPLKVAEYQRMSVVSCVCVSIDGATRIHCIDGNELSGLQSQQTHVIADVHQTSEQLCETQEAAVRHSRTLSLSEYTP